MTFEVGVCGEFDNRAPNGLEPSLTIGGILDRLIDNRGEYGMIEVEHKELILPVACAA